MKLVDLVGLHIEASSGAPLVLLREHDAPHRVLPIFVGEPEAASIALAVSGQAAPRPLSHDVMSSLVQSFDAQVDAVEVTELSDGTFLAAISVSGPGGGHRLDTRPSDAIALAVRVGAPMFVSDEVLDQAGTVVREAPDDETIDEEVAEFRHFLGEIDPSAFFDESSRDDADEPGVDDGSDEHPGEDADGGAVDP